MGMIIMTLTLFRLHLKAEGVTVHGRLFGVLG